MNHKLNSSFQMRAKKAYRRESLEHLMTGHRAILFLVLFYGATIISCIWYNSMPDREAIERNLKWAEHAARWPLEQGARKMAGEP